jgi:hypothetical protein
VHTSPQDNQSITELGGMIENSLYFENSIRLQASDKMPQAIDQIVEKGEIIEASVENPRSYAVE